MQTIADFFNAPIGLVDIVVLSAVVIGYFIGRKVPR